MRPLTESESRAVFNKLQTYIGDNVRLLLDRPDGSYCLRMHRNRVFYINEDLMKRALHIDRKHLLSVGTCLGRFTKNTNSFRIHVTSLHIMAPYAKHKVWLREQAAQRFLYGQNGFKSGLARITEDTPRMAGVIVYSQTQSGGNVSDIPIGFGLAARASSECRQADPGSIVVLRQADVGEFLRHEQNII